VFTHLVKSIESDEDARRYEFSDTRSKEWLSSGTAEAQKFRQ